MQLSLSRFCCLKQSLPHTFVNNPQWTHWFVHWRYPYFGQSLVPYLGLVVVCGGLPRNSDTQHQVRLATLDHMAHLISLPDESSQGFEQRLADCNLWPNQDVFEQLMAWGWFFKKIHVFICCLYMYFCLYMGLCDPYSCRCSCWPENGNGFSFTVNCDLPDVGARNQTWVLYKNNTQA